MTFIVELNVEIRPVCLKYFKHTGLISKIYTIKHVAKLIIKFMFKRVSEAGAIVH